MKFEHENQDLDLATTPTILHLGGATFDLINPRDSLKLSDIEISPEENEQMATNSSFHALRNRVANLIPNKDGDDESETTSTPPPKKLVFRTLTDARRNLGKGTSSSMPFHYFS